MIIFGYFYRQVFNFTRLRSLRELILIIGTFTCLSIYLTTFLFDASSTHHSIINDRFVWNYQQSSRNILSNNGLLINNHYSNSTVKWKFNFKESLSKSLDKNQLELMRRIRKLLQEIEKSSLPNAKEAKLALIRGQRSVISRDFPLYRWALEKNGFVMNAPSWLRSRRRNSTVTGQNLTEATDWLLLICLAYTDGDAGICSERKDFQKLKPFQKINRIPGLRNLLWRKDFFCSTMNEARKIPTLMKHPFSPLCFVMPNQYQQFIDVADALGYSANWMLKPIAIGGQLSGPGPQPLNIFTSDGRTKLRDFTIKKGIVQQYIPNPLYVFGQLVNLRFYVVVTSITPLRAFIHEEGLVYHRHDEDKNYKRIPGHTWTLSQFWQFISRNFGTDKTKKTVKNIHRIILQTLLITEAMFVTQYHQTQYQANNINLSDQIRRCTSCFHLMAFDVMLNSSLHPWILEVNGQPNMQENSKDESPLSSRIKRLVIDDLINMISATNLIVDDVVDALEEVIADNIGVMGVTCQISHDLCLSNEDLHYLIQSRREGLNRRGYKQLYPALDAENEKQLIDELANLISQTRMGLTNNMVLYRTADWHSLLIALERFYYRHIIDEEFGDGAGQVGQGQTDNNNSSINSIYKTLAISSSNNCSDEPSTLPHLSSIDLFPKLTLSPPFSPFVNQYFANASYEQLLITVSATAQNCQSEVRLDDKYGSSRPTNYTLGVGNNKITFVIVDVSHTEPWVINTYTLTIKRLSFNYNTKRFNKNFTHQVCSFIQDCDMRVFPLNPCGLTKETAYKNWKNYLFRQSLNPLCDSGSSPGRWILPCEKCDDRSSCFWNEIRWDPFNCRHPVLKRKAILKCLENKKLLFLGDSTNRGMMHYLLEKINGTLMEWDKTHDFKIYPNMNNKRTQISFAYYPKFWLPSDQRPSFERAVYQLFEKIQPLENDSNTILIFGGVQWLANQHIKMLFKALSNSQLQGIKLIMKTLGAGFHQPIDGIHCLSLAEHQKLALHNSALAKNAQKLGIEVIDTYNMTIARYKDFLPGKCACHFHSVIENQSSNLKSSSHIHYQVIGPINAIYTEIMISRICNSFSNSFGNGELLNHKL